MEDIKKWLWEGFKTAARYFIIAVTPIALDWGIQYVQVLLFGVSDLKIGETEKWMIRLALAGVDKTLHEWKKNTKSEGSWKGLIGF